MTPYDVAMVGVIVAGMVWGAFKGITWQLASLASLVLGYMVSHTLSSQVAPYFPGDPVVARALAMLALYVATAGGIFFVAWCVRATLQKLKFEAFDRHLGMLLGGLEGTLLGLVATLFVVSVAPQTRGPIFSSPTGKVVGQVMSAVGPVLPEEARNVLAPFWSGKETVAETPDAIPSLRVDTAPPVKARPTAKASGKRDDAASPASLNDLIQEGEARLGKAIKDGAAQGIKQAVGGGDDGTVERR